jgi:hypothetical protein
LPVIGAFGLGGIRAVLTHAVSYCSPVNGIPADRGVCTIISREFCLAAGATSAQKKPLTYWHIVFARCPFCPEHSCCEMARLIFEPTHQEILYLAVAEKKNISPLCAHGAVWGSIRTCMVATGTNRVRIEQADAAVRSSGEPQVLERIGLETSKSQTRRFPWLKEVRKQVVVETPLRDGGKVDMSVRRRVEGRFNCQPIL